MPTVQSFAIIGAGALGAYYGARLVQGGQDVHFLLRSDYDVWRKSGLEIHSCAGDFSLPPDRLQVYRHSTEMPEPDWVIVALKSTDNDQFESLIKPLLGRRTAILTLQNGLGNEQRLADLFGANRITGGVAFTCINRLRPAVIDHSSHGLIRFGEFANQSSDRTAQLASIFKTCNIPCEPTDSLVSVRWEKLIWNIPFNGLSAILDQTTDQILSTPQGETLVRRIMNEVVASGRACGATLHDKVIDANIDYTKTMGAYRSSMQVDRQMGRPLEIDAILRQPLEAAASHGVSTPSMQMLYELARMLPSVRNVSD